MKTPSIARSSITAGRSLLLRGVIHSGLGLGLACVLFGWLALLAGVSFGIWAAAVGLGIAIGWAVLTPVLLAAARRFDGYAQP